MKKGGLRLDTRDELAILMAMTLLDQLPLAEVKNRLSEVVEQVEVEHARVTITKHGRPAAVLISADDLESLEETLVLLSDPEAMTQIRNSRVELEAGKGVILTKEQALAKVRR
jgi:antitoxin YefM